MKQEKEIRPINKNSKLQRGECKTSSDHQSSHIQSFWTEMVQKLPNLIVQDASVPPSKTIFLVHYSYERASSEDCTV